MNNMLNIVEPFPGTKEALDQGCICPVIDNHYGKGHHGIEGEFVVNMECEVHTLPVDELQKNMGITESKD